MSKARAESFSDGVIAVAITLLILDVHVPEASQTSSLASDLGRQWPNYAAYVVSFLTIGIIWINHHAMLRRIVGVDHAILVLNLLLLMSIVVLPFTTALMAEYLTADHGQRLAALIYGASLLVMALLFVATQRLILVGRTNLVKAELTDSQRRYILRRNAIGVIPYTAATLAALITPYLTLGITAAVALFFALPATTADHGDNETSS
jgi:uncharacterized membrane protein